MVNKLLKNLNFLFPLLLIINLFLARSTFAGEFSASVSENEIGYRQKLKLTLKLNDETPKQQPDLNSIQDNFEVLSTSSQNSARFINGDHSTEYKWIYILRPLKKGPLKLGPFTIKTKSGEKSTETINVNILDAKVKSAPKQEKATNTAHHNIFVTTEVSKNNPYRKEPFIYYLRLFTDVNMHGIVKSKLEIDGAITEQIGDYKIFDRTHDGKPYRVMEWSFHITPLKSGLLEIPEIEVIGQIPASSKRPSIDDLFNSPLGNNFDDYHFDSLAIRRSEEFLAYSDKITIDVQASKDTIDPWVPAKSLQLFDQWESNSFMAGRPFTRTLSLHASGLLASQLPDIEVKSEPGEYKIFNDPGKVLQNIDNNLITSSKEIKLTYIPQTHGNITIPEIKIEYWNVDKNAVDSTILPAKQIYVERAADEIQKEVIQSDDKRINTNEEGSTAKSPAAAPMDSSTQTLQIIIAVVAGIIITLAVGAIIFLLRKKKAAISMLPHSHHSRQQSISEVKAMSSTTAKKLNTSITVIKGAENANDIQKFIQNYAHNHWQLQQNLSVYSILLQIKSRHSEFDYDKYQDISKKLDRVLYAGGKVDLELLKGLCIELISHVDSIVGRTNGSTATRKTKKLPKINPS